MTCPPQIDSFLPVKSNCSAAPGREPRLTKQPRAVYAPRQNCDTSLLETMRGKISVPRIAPRGSAIWATATDRLTISEEKF